jgi:hypothetical protein
MSPILPTPLDPATDGRRRAQITNRTARVRTLGTAGAIAALGIFTGLSATHQSPATPASTAVAQVAANRNTSSQTQSGIAAATGSGAATSSSTS